MASHANQIIEEVAEDQLDESPAAFDVLPDECILSVLDYLPQKDLVSLSTLSRRFNRLVDRTFRVRIADKMIMIRFLPSALLQRFGPSIRELSFERDADEEVVGAICELCPNLTKMYFLGIQAAAFCKPSFRRMLKQLHELEIERILNIAATPTFESSLKSTLQQCEHIKRLRLGNIVDDQDRTISNFQPFFQNVFPKLGQIEINLDNSSPNESFMPFLRSNTNIKTLWIETEREEVDLSGIADLQQVEQLFLMSNKNLWMPRVIPNLHQLSELGLLKLATTYRRAILDEFFDSLHRFQNLTTLMLTLTDETKNILDIRDKDLMKLKMVPNLIKFSMSTARHKTYVTLPGILQVLKDSPNVSDFGISGFRQNYSPDGTILIDDDLYTKFRDAYFEEKGRKIRARIHKLTYEHDFKWFHFGRAINRIDILERCLDD